jgi:hypothetical protein
VFGSADRPAFCLGEQPAPEFDQRPVPLRLLMPLVAVTRLHANAVVICDGSDEPQSATLEQRPHSFAAIRGRNTLRIANGQALAYIYSRDNEAEARQAKTLTADEARRIAANIVRLPELVAKSREQQG